MGYYDELDDEIDREMGWKRGKRGGKDSPRRDPAYWQAILKTAHIVSSPIWRFFGSLRRGTFKVIFFPILAPHSFIKRTTTSGEVVVVKRSLMWRLFDGIITRILLTPIILALFMMVLVYCSTHPQAVHALSNPRGYGIYYEKVTIETDDHLQLSAWYMPPLNAEEVAFDPEASLLQKWPGVVVCHGMGSSHDEYLPLAQELHKAGFAVLMLDTRGQGESKGSVTYGLKERFDIVAGARFLRGAPYVDESKVCVVGRDIDAIAALQAATIDPGITAVAADGLWQKFDERTKDIFSQPMPQTGPLSFNGGRMPTQWLAPLYTLTFKISVRDPLNQLDPDTVVRNIKQPVLFVARLGDQYAPVQDILALAHVAGSKHDVIIDKNPVDDVVEKRIVEFLMQSTGWKGPKAHGAQQIQDLLKNQVK